jgi:hypothetical protein
MGGKRRLQGAGTAVKAKIETITPDMAFKLMEKTDADPEFKNRKLVQSRIDFYAREIKAGNWSPSNGETVKIDGLGVVIDGQHRMYAVIEANKAIKVLVARNCDRNSFTTIDVGYARTAGNMLAQMGVESPRNVAAALQWLHRYRNERMTGGTGLENSLSKEELRRLLDAEPGVANGGPAYSAVKKLLAPSAVYVAMHLFTEDRNEAEAFEFFESLGSGENLKRTDPVYALRERLIARRTDPQKRKLSTVEMIALTFKAWQMVVDGRSLKSARNLVWSKGREAFPYLHKRTRSQRVAKKKAKRKRAGN